jgi:uncharacterized protein YegL
MQQQIKTYMQFHDENVPFPFPEKEEEEKYSFGIMKITANSEEDKIKKNKHQHFIFSIDKSGSMSYPCKDKKTKLQHIQFTLENMLIMFANSNLEISIQVNVFDHNVGTCIHETKVTKENVHELITKVKSIIADGSTNLEDAIKLAKKNILEYKRKYPDHEINHILLTDGVPNIKNTNADILKHDILDDYQNIFLGYGTDHDPVLLEKLANNIHGSYFFIDALEKASFVYGEIIHNIMNIVMKDITYLLSNAEIYNYLTNTWEKVLKEGKLINGLQKIYQIRSTNPELASCSMTNKLNNEKIICYPEKNRENLTKYAFRQKTQEFLFEANEQTENANTNTNMNANYIFTNTYFETIEETKIKNTIYDFLQLLITYRKENNLEDDKFTKMLYDDLFITWKTLGTERCGIYTCARKISQGRQTTYHVSLEEEEQNSDQDQDNQITFPYGLSDHIDSPYSINALMDTMLTCSQQQDENENEKTVLL